MYFFSGVFKERLFQLMSYSIAGVWFVNGFYCKVLALVPRHEEIVGRILGDTYSKPLTMMIGLSEIGMAIWILSGYKSRLNAILQIAVIALMNLLEFILVPDLLYWGRINAFYAFLFILLIYFKEFRLNNRPPVNA